MLVHVRNDPSCVHVLLALSSPFSWSFQHSVSVNWSIIGSGVRTTRSLRQTWSSTVLVNRVARSSICQLANFACLLLCGQNKNKLSTSYRPKTVSTIISAVNCHRVNLSPCCRSSKLVKNGQLVNCNVVPPISGQLCRIVASSHWHCHLYNCSTA